jgi:hypothetical protein
MEGTASNLIDFFPKERVLDDLFNRFFIITFVDLELLNFREADGPARFCTSRGMIVLVGLA